MTNALLLRLFTSEFFNSWIAVSYLFRYSDNVGIQHYLCNQLKKFPVSEIEFFLPQLIHLLITRPSDSVALECFLVESSERSTHMAVMTLWYLQAYLSDLSLNPNSASFELCKRLLNKCQAIVFSSNNDEESMNSRVKENAIPALVGVGALLLGVGQPRMTKPAGRIAIAQGRRNRTLSITCQQEESKRTTRRNTVDVVPSVNVQHEKKSTSSEPPLLNIAELKYHTSQAGFIDKESINYSHSLHDLHGGKAFSRYIKNAQQKINQKITRYQQTDDDENRPYSSSSLSNHLSIYDPNLTALGQSSVPTNTPLSPALSNSCCCSTDEIQHKHSKLSCSSVSLTSSSSVSTSDDEEIKSPLFHSNYFRSEMQFILALVDIATRLVIVPKEARMSALHAELTLLNQHLPAEICLPLWCPATSEKPFHQCIVRISPSDAVVLNSAERAPYLLMIEVLDDEMRFDDADDAFMLKKRQKQHKCIKKKAFATPTHDVMDMVDFYKEEETVKETMTDDYADRMRTAAVMLTQLQQSVVSCNTQSNNKSKPQEQIRQRIIKEMMALEEQRVLKMKTEGGLGLIDDETDMLQDKQRIAMVVNKEDPSAAVLSEDWETKKARLRAASPYGHLPNWRLISVIVKNGADLRQEQFAVQLIREMQLIWADTGVDVWVKYFRILVTSDSSGIMETLKNTVSIHSIKKNAYTRGWNQKDTLFTLYDYFKKVWGPVESEEYLKAQDAFMRSLAGYSIACYVLQIKDRHNGNLLIDESGHLIHIDFGFMLSNSPGSVGFEMAPFKLPQEYIDILGGIHGEKFAEYKALMKAAFLAIRKHSENILLLTEMMSISSKLPCFQNGELTVAQLRDRFQLHLTEPQAEEFVDKLIMNSCCNVFTKLYDTFQYYSQGIL